MNRVGIGGGHSIRIGGAVDRPPSHTTVRTELVYGGSVT